jgi:hypothetical protein
LLGCRQAVVEDRGQASSFGGMQRLVLTPRSVLVHAQSASEDQSDCPEMAQVDVRQGHLGLVPRRLGQLARFDDRRQAVVPGAHVIEQTLDGREEFVRGRVVGPVLRC